MDLPIFGDHSARQVAAADQNVGTRIGRPDALRGRADAVFLDERLAFGELDRDARRAEQSGAGSAINRSARPASPDALAMARSISALATWRSRAGTLVSRDPFRTAPVESRNPGSRTLARFELPHNTRSD